MATPKIAFDNAAAAELAARLLAVVQDASAETMLLASMAIAQFSAACVAAELGLSAPRVFSTAFEAASEIVDIETTSSDVS